MVMYEYTDKIIAYLVKRYVKLFSKAKSVMPFDELNILSYSNGLYSELEKVTIEKFLQLAQYIYNVYADKPKKVSKDWLLEYLMLYNPTTRYVFMHEIERKKSRFAESMVATSGAASPIADKRKKPPFVQPVTSKMQARANRAAEIKRALNLWSGMAKQYADDVTLAAALQAYKDNGVKRVRWYTVPDERRCDDCKALHGKVFDIDKVPPKPHYRCRCWLEPVR